MIWRLKREGKCVDVKKLNTFFWLSFEVTAFDWVSWCAADVPKKQLVFWAGTDGSDVWPQINIYTLSLSPTPLLHWGPRCHKTSQARAHPHRWSQSRVWRRVLPQLRGPWSVECPGPHAVCRTGPRFPAGLSSRAHKARAQPLSEGPGCTPDTPVQWLLQRRDVTSKHDTLMRENKADCAYMRCYWFSPGLNSIAPFRKANSVTLIFSPLHITKTILTPSTSPTGTPGSWSRPPLSCVKILCNMLGCCVSIVSKSTESCTKPRTSSGAQLLRTSRSWSSAGKPRKHGTFFTNLKVLTSTSEAAL